MTRSQENGQKSHFGKNCLQNVQKWAKMSFPDHGLIRKVVDNVENYLYMQFQPKLMTVTGYPISGFWVLGLDPLWVLGGLRSWVWFPISPSLSPHGVCLNICYCLFLGRIC